MKNNIEEKLDNLHLVYFNLIGKTTNGDYKYELMFSENIEDVWGEYWNQVPAGMCGDIPPSQDNIHKTIEINSKILFDTATKNTCFSMGDCIDGIIPLAWENISNYNEYPEERLIFHYGVEYNYILNKI